MTFFAGVTTMFVKMVAAMERDDAPRPVSLRLCISGGEPRNEAAFDRWRELTGTPVHDVYAASECFPVVTYDPTRDPLPRRGFAGRVVDDAAMRIVGPDGSDVALNEAGEAWVHGPALMLGYWNDPQTTAAALTDDGWYRMGDLVEMDDGYVRVVGRLNDVIIHGGANVSPAEVERVLVSHPAVREAAVVGVADPVYGQQVVAAVVPEGGAAPEAEELQAHCAASLAAYKRPTRYVFVDQLPRNANTGKVQRRDVAEHVAVELAR